MRWNLLNQPLGIGVCDFAPMKAEIPIAIPLALAAASAASSIYGGVKSSQANKDATAKLEAEKAATEAERRRRKYEAWGTTASGQNTIRMLRDEADRQWRRMQGAAAVGGASESSVAAEKELQNLKQAEVIAQANANYEDRKDAVDASYRQQLSGLTQQQIANDKERAANVTAAAGQMSSALGTAAMTTFGDTKLGQQWLGGGTTRSYDGPYKDAYNNLLAANSIDWMRRNAIFQPRLQTMK